MLHNNANGPPNSAVHACIALVNGWKARRGQVASKEEFHPLLALLLLYHINKHAQLAIYIWAHGV